MTGEAGHPPRADEDAVARISRLVVLLGPYRNLTTLTASVCALHPRTQVLNHAGTRIWKDASLDIIARPEPGVLRDFLGAALAAATGGRKGDFGGSILLSHAYTDPRMQELYRARFGEALDKPDATCLVWKESLRVQNRLAAQDGLADAMLAALPELSFLLPLRHPVDCALSNLRTGHVKMLVEGEAPGEAQVVDAVLDAFAWGLRLRDRWPERVLAFHAGEIGGDLLARLEAFMGHEADARWRDDAAKAFRVRPSPAWDAALVAHFQKSARERLAAWPDVLSAFGV